MAILTKADGTKIDLGETTGEFTKRLTINRIAERGYSSSEENALKSSGYTSEQINEMEASAKQFASLTLAQQKEFVTLGAEKYNAKVQAEQQAQSQQIISAGVYDLQKQQSRKATDFEIMLLQAQQQNQAQSFLNKPQTQSVQQYIKTAGKKNELVFFQIDPKTGEQYGVGTLNLPSVKTEEQKSFEDLIKKGEASKVNYEDYTGFEKRISNLVEREKKINALEQSVFTKLKIDQNQKDKWIIGQAKGLARFPLSIPGGAVKIGGRLAFSSEALFHKEGRALLASNFKKVPSAVVEQYNPKNPDFTANVLATGLFAKGVLKQAKVNYNIKQSNTIGATKSATVTNVNAKGIAQSESIFKGVQKVGKSEYLIKGESRAFSSNVQKGVLTKAYSKAQILSKASKSKVNVKTQSVGITTGEKTIFLTKGKIGRSNIRTVDIIKSQTKAGKTTFAGVEFTSGARLKSIQPKNVYVGTSKDVFIKTRLTESGQYFDTTTLSKAGQINTGVKIKGLTPTTKPTPQQLKVLKDFKASTETPTITQTISTTGAQSQALVSQNIFVQTVKGIYKQENPTRINPLPFRTQTKTQAQLIEPTKTSIVQAKPIVKPIVTTQTKSNTKTITEPIIKTVITPKTKTGSALRIRTISLQEQKQIQEPRPIQITVPKVRNILGLTIKQKPVVIPQVKPVITTFKPSKGLTGFDVFVKKKGVFQKANVQPLEKSQALSFGAFKTSTTASATFKIKPSTNKGLGKFFGGTNLLSNFYASKKGQDTFIQKRSKRIGTPGEKYEITYKGLYTRKNKARLF